MSVVVELKKPIKVNGVEVNRLALREPTLGDELNCLRQAGDDRAKYELIMFANLVECAPEDLHALTLRDYKALQQAYFRLVE